jgi:hypothetical protein
MYRSRRSEKWSLADCATEWSGGKVIDLGGLPGFTSSSASSINDAGQAVVFARIGRKPRLHLRHIALATELLAEPHLPNRRRAAP